MMMEYLAHSARGNQPAQTYAAHIQGVLRRSSHYVDELREYHPDSEELKNIVLASSYWHDLGKLEQKNQHVLQDTAETSRHLPINHVDAGSAELVATQHLMAALLVYAHHRGLPDMIKEGIRDKSFFRDEKPSVRAHTDATLAQLVALHHAVLPTIHIGQDSRYKGNPNVYTRMLLSCLADADHSDTAAAYGHGDDAENLPALLAHERLATLDCYVARLGGDDERSNLRRIMYEMCRNKAITTNFSICDSPVGSGKTTAVMAHLLRQAELRHARRIIVVLPYTSIIDQSVEVYRKALVLPGENPESVVAGLHCRAEFDDAEVRYLTSLWRAPIIVTTAVAFYTTLASNKPASLRKLHELPGSMIFVDESHNALPIKLLPLGWQWMNTLANEWGCYWVMASGSLVRFWEHDVFPGIELEKPDIQTLVDLSLRTKLMKYEQNRIRFCWNDTPLRCEELIQWTQKAPGPRLLIMNTVQTAAVVANEICQKYGRDKVEHVSTALTPIDRSTTIKRIKKRLQNKNDTDWTLVATSCVEAGVDLSFRTGYRELSSLLSLLQSAGRVNRHGLYSNAEMWSFSMMDDSRLTRNESLRDASSVLKNYFREGRLITAELSTQGIKDELSHGFGIKEIKDLLQAESNQAYEEVEQKFKVIESDTIPAIVDERLAFEILQGRGNWREIQKKSVSIRLTKIKPWNLRELAKGVYQWTRHYDPFLGYMDGVINQK